MGDTEQLIPYEDEGHLKLVPVDLTCQRVPLNKGGGHRGYQVLEVFHAPKKLSEKENGGLDGTQL